jgi:U3 small nucleolar RNA-associated protein 14
LKSAGLKDEDIQHTEEAMLQMNPLSVEEVAQRRGELRKMRELLFRAEVKAKRVGKIKSRAYRRIKRKEKERTDEMIDDNEDEEEIFKKGLDRARERATLRHKHTGKWARQMRHKEGLNEDSRRDIEDMLVRGEKLRRRVEGIGSDKSEDDSDDQDDDYGDDGFDVEGGLEKIKQDAFDELQKLDKAEGVEGSTESQNGKGVFGMKFMKYAMARQMRATNKSMDDFIQEMGGNTGTGDSDGEEQEKGSKVLDSSSGVLLERKGGRVMYRPSETVGFHVTYGCNFSH